MSQSVTKEFNSWRPSPEPCNEQRNGLFNQNFTLGQISNAFKGFQDMSMVLMVQLLGMRQQRLWWWWSWWIIIRLAMNSVDEHGISFRGSWAPFASVGWKKNLLVCVLLRKMRLMRFACVTTPLPPLSPLFAERVFLLITWLLRCAKLLSLRLLERTSSSARYGPG